MNLLLGLLMVILLTISSVFAAYLWFLAFFGIRIRKGNYTVQKINRFAILVSARNEEKIISVLLDSLKKLSYPKEYYDCYFAADYCNDKTAEKIKESGFDCYEKEVGPIGKANALSWLIGNVLKDGGDKYDAFVFFDADNKVSPGFLTVMNCSLNEGNEIIQANTDIIDWESSTFTILNYFNYLVINRFRENARSNLGLSCRLRGHGMCFKRKILEDFGWPIASLVEDRDLWLQVILKGMRVIWEHTAKVFSKLPSNISDSRKQRLRWSMAKHANLKRTMRLLSKQLTEKFSWIKLDAFMELITPSNSMLVAILALTWFISLFPIKGHGLLLKVATVEIILYLFYFLLGVILEKAPLKYLFYFFISPFFIFWRAWIFILSMHKGKKLSWK